MSVFETKSIKTVFCVVGGGLSGLSAAVEAARHGVETVLVQDRPMLGGNASSEVRMWVCGAHGDNMRETGIVEELIMENQYRNPYKNYSIWDSVMLGLAWKEKNLTLLLNTSCISGENKGDRLAKITCWQLTTQKYIEIEAEYFADCSGDSVLAPISGAPYRAGREARGEFGESIAPEKSDAKTMGMSCMIVAREYPSERIYTAPQWAKSITAESLGKYRVPNLTSSSENFWYLELGGMRDAIGDTEEIRDELIKLAYGLWDYLKNDPSNREKNKNFDIDWIGILPGKRESRRYEGDIIMNQHDVESGGHFDDIIAYGGWSMDDHHPGGFEASEYPPTIFHPAPSPYGIAYRCLYSRKIENLFFAGRNISVTHSAMSSTRVMATCAILGQAVGAAAYIAAREGTTPRGVYEEHIEELQQLLLDDDCYIPYLIRKVPEICAEAALISDMDTAESLRNGFDRPVGSFDNGARGKPGCFARYDFKAPQSLSSLRFIFDSDLNRATLPYEEAKLQRPMFHNILLNREASHPPKTLVKDFDVIFKGENGEIKISIRGNYQRLVRLSPDSVCDDIGLIHSVEAVFLETWGSDEIHVFSFDARGKE